MNAYLLVGAGLSSIGGVLHSFLGERLIFPKLTTVNMPGVLGSSLFTVQVLRLFWHLVSIAWWGFAVLLVLLASTPLTGTSRQLAWTIAAAFLASAVLSFAISHGKHFSWGVLLVTAMVIWLGAR